MKRITRKRRLRDVRQACIARSRKSPRYRRKKQDVIGGWVSVNKWIDENTKNGLQVTFHNTKLTLNLPAVMNFSNEYEVTALYMTGIRKLAARKWLPRSAYKLVAVNFDRLVEISTSAALVLTAELSKWDDATRQRLRPEIEGWNRDILEQFDSLGFFDLFQNNPSVDSLRDKEGYSGVKFVKYIKGQCGHSGNNTRLLKEGIREVIGETVEKWTFLHGGLDEAITNVSHHAYPSKCKVADGDKNWYLTGSYSQATKQLKIVFYDQGVGIPNSLPASGIWEKTLAILANYHVAERKKDEVLLRAAVEIDRTSSGENDRGRGLQDLLEFVKQRRNGHLSIISSRGLYKYTVDDGSPSVKSFHFQQKMNGTLIIWSVALKH